MNQIYLLKKNEKYKKIYAIIITEETMAGHKNTPFYTVLGFVIIVGLLTLGLWFLNPNLFNKVDTFKGTMSADSNYSSTAGQNAVSGSERESEVKGNPDVVPNDSTGPADFGSSEAPSGCYPRDQLTPSELLPKDGNSVWAEQNPMGNGSLKGKNFLSAGALIGVNTVGQSLRNANYQLRSEPPNPQVPVSVFQNSTIEPDVNRRNLEIA